MCVNNLWNVYMRLFVKTEIVRILTFLASQRESRCSKRRIKELSFESEKNNWPTKKRKMMNIKERSVQ